MGCFHWIQDVRNSYEGDEEATKLISELATLQNGILYYKNVIYVGKVAELREKVVQALHGWLTYWGTLRN